MRTQTHTHTDMRAHTGTDLLVEAVFEDLGVKHKVIGEMESILPEHAIIATNTSAIPIAEIAKGSKRPERVIGMHYFSPVDKMPLLEIIPHSGTDKDVLAAAMQVGLKQGKTVISVKDVPGFYINRCLGPFLAEVMALVLQGVPLPEMDKAMRTWGMPVGPITLADEVGIDVANHLQYNLKELGVRMASGSDQNLMQVTAHNAHTAHAHIASVQHMHQCMRLHATHGTLRMVR